MQETDKGYAEWRRLGAEVTILGWIVGANCFALVLVATLLCWIFFRLPEDTPKPNAPIHSGHRLDPELPIVKEGVQVQFVGEGRATLVTVDGRGITATRIDQ